MGHRLFHLIRKFKRTEKGSVAIEFAFVAPVFLYVMLAVIDTGLMLFYQNSIQTSVDLAARQMKTGQAQKNALTDALFKQKICDRLSSMLKCTDLTVTTLSAPTFTQLATMLPSPGSVGKMPDGTISKVSYSCGAPYEAVGIIATYDWKSHVPFFTIMGNTHDSGVRRLYGMAIFRNEPFPSALGKCPPPA